MGKTRAQANPTYDQHGKGHQDTPTEANHHAPCQCRLFMPHKTAADGGSTMQQGRCWVWGHHSSGTL